MNRLRDWALALHYLPRTLRRRRELRARARDDPAVPVRVLGAPGPHEIVCVTRCRDEALRLPAFLEHHRGLGVERFAVVDNGSTDGSVELLEQAPDVDLFVARGSLAAASAGITWFQQLFDRYGSRRWYLVADVDELLVYVGMDRHGLHDLARHLARRGRLGLAAYMVDMYPDGPLDDLDYRPGASLVQACPFFDGDGYVVERKRRRPPSLVGGPRRRLFGQKQSLHKLPFFHHTALFAHRSIHEATSARYALEPEGALLHFKLLQDFRAKVEEAVRHRHYWRGSAEYAAIREGLRARASLDFRCAGSRRFEGPVSLVDAGLMSALSW